MEDGFAGDDSSNELLRQREELLLLLLVLQLSREERSKRGSEANIHMGFR